MSHYTKKSLQQKEDALGKILHDFDKLKKQIEKISGKNGKGMGLNKKLEILEQKYNLEHQQSHKTSIPSKNSYKVIKTKNYKGHVFQDTSVSFDLNVIQGHLINDICLHVKFGKIKAPAGQYVRYAALPVMRLLKKVSYENNKETFLEYTRECVTSFIQFETKDSNKKTMAENMGQQQIKRGIFNRPDRTETNEYMDGLQTLKEIQEETDVSSNLFFRFCSRPGFSLMLYNPDNFSGNKSGKPSNKIILDLEDINKIVQFFEEVEVKDPETEEVTKKWVRSSHRIQSHRIDFELLVNVTTLLPKVYNSLIGGFVMDRYIQRRVHLRKIISKPDAIIDLTQFKRSITVLYISIKKLSNIDNLDTWYLHGDAEEEDVNNYIIYVKKVPATSVTMFFGQATNITSRKSVVKDISLDEQGLKILDKVNPTMVNKYMTTRFPSISPINSCSDNNILVYLFTTDPYGTGSPPSLLTPKQYDRQLELTIPNASIQNQYVVHVSGIGLSQVYMHGGAHIVVN